LEEAGEPAERRLLGKERTKKRRDEKTGRRLASFCQVSARERREGEYGERRAALHLAS